MPSLRSVINSAPAVLALALLAPLAAQQPLHAGTGTDWTDLTAASPTRPRARLMHGLVYDGGRDRCVLFGGSPDYFTAMPTSTWELAGDTWVDMGIRTPQPFGRFGHSMVFDYTRAQTILFGGRHNAQTLFSDTWTWDGVVWTELPTSGPLGRYVAAMTYAGPWGGNLLFGGSHFLNEFPSLNDTWFLNSLTATWTQLTPITSPPPMAGAALTFDQARGVAVLVGRTRVSTEQEIWEFDRTTWTRRNSAVGPVPRGGNAIAYDHLRQRTLMFGGGWWVMGVQSDSWEWNGDTWTERSPLNVPSGREWHAMAWDTLRHRCVLFGGQSGSFGLGVRDDTWQYAYPCDVFGPGHQGGGLPITCTTPPRLRTSFCVQFPAATGVGGMLLGLHEPTNPPLPFPPPLMCDTGLLYTLGDIVLNTTGNPAMTCIPVPADPALAWAAFTLQGVSLEPAGCLRLTDALVFVLQP